MDSIIQRHLKYLRLISEIMPGQKLSTTNGLSIVDTDNKLIWFLRVWSKDSRHETVRMLIELYENIEKCINEYIKDYSEDKKRYLLIKMAETLQDSVTGIESLVTTYKGDQNIKVRFDSIVYDYLLPIYSTILKNTDKSLHTDKLKKSIIYNDANIYEYNIE